MTQGSLCECVSVCLCECVSVCLCECVSQSVCVRVCVPGMNMGGACGLYWCVRGSLKAVRATATTD